MQVVRADRGRGVIVEHSTDRDLARSVDDAFHAAPGPLELPVEVATIWLPTGVDAVASARAHVSEVLTSWDVDGDCVADAVLLVSELAGHVVGYSSARSVGIDVGATARRIVVGVRESGTTELPQSATHLLADHRPTGAPDPGPRGRALRILDALAAEWGVSRGHLSTSTWFTLAPSNPPPLRAVSPPAAAQLEAVQASLRRTQLLLRITEHLGSAVTAEQVGEVVTRHLRDHLGATFTGIAVFTPDGGAGPDARDDTGSGRMMRYLDLSAFPAATRAEFASFALDVDVPVAAAALTRTAFFHQDHAAAEHEFAGLAARMTTAGVGALAHLPLIAAGRCLGTLAVAWAEPRTIDADTRALLTIVAGYAAHALYRHGAAGSFPEVDDDDHVSLRRAGQRLTDARAEFEAALEFGESLQGLVAAEQEIRRATAALDAARDRARREAP